MQGVPPEKVAQLPDYLDKSNVFSSNESLLLYWMEVVFQKEQPLLQKRLGAFDMDLQDG